MIHLPTPPRKSWIAGFWVAFNAVTGTVLAATLGVLGARRLALAVMLLTLLVALAGRLWDWRIARSWYRAWNGLGIAYARFAGWVIVRLCYYVIVWPVARSGSRLQLDRQDSLWVAREQPEGGRSRRGFRGNVTYRKNWSRNYVRWAMTSDNTWALTLMPFIAFLMKIGPTGGDSETPLNIYTLY